VSATRPARFALTIAVALTLLWAGARASTAEASLGELSFVGCLGQLSGCATVPAGMAGAVEVPKSLVVSPDGEDVYAADEAANVVDVFTRDALTGTLTLSGCVGQHAGCATTTPAHAVAQPEAIAVSPDGKNVYAGSVGSNAIVEFARSPSTGALEYLGCIGQPSGCTPTSPTAAVNAPASIALSADGASLYVASESAGAVDEFSRDASTGLLEYTGCIGESGCRGPTASGSMFAAGSVAVSPDGANVYVGAEGGALSTFTRNTASGVLTFAGCIGRLPECAKPKPEFAVNEPLSVLVSPDGANVYAGNFNNEVVDELSRNAATGTLTFKGCIGHYAEEPAACTATPKGSHGVPEGPLQIAISPDGADLYVASDYSVSELSRGSGGILSYAGCIGNVPGTCTETSPAEAVFFQTALAVSPNGANLYSGDQLSHGVDEFGRITQPVCTGVSVAVPYQTPTPLTLSCADADGKPVGFSIEGGPSHGSLGAVGAGGQVTYTPAAGYSGPDSFTFTAHNEDGTAAPAIATISVGPPPSTTGPPTQNGGGVQSTPGIATTPQAVEELLLGCSKRALNLNDVLIRGARVLLQGSAAKSLDGKKVEIVFDGSRRVASATVGADGEFSATAPLPPARLRDSNSARYMAESGRQRSLDLKLTRRLGLEPPHVSGDTVTLVGQVVPPLAKPPAAIKVEQQLECGKTTIVRRATPSADGRFRITLTVPAEAKAGIYRLASTVRESSRSERGFATYSLPLPVALG
jgi:DNA-binding beta-propeller fold protein YncE